jgi:hypothetical protein
LEVMDYAEIRTMLETAATTPQKAVVDELRNAQHWLASRVNPQQPGAGEERHTNRGADIAQEEVAKVLRLLAERDFDGASQAARKALGALD